MLRPLLTLAGCVLLTACAPQRSGPTPQVDSVSPATICLAGGAATLTIDGADFTPLAP